MLANFKCLCSYWVGWLVYQDISQQFQSCRLVCPSSHISGLELCGRPAWPHPCNNCGHTLDTVSHTRSCIDFHIPHDSNLQIWFYTPLLEYQDIRFHNQSELKNYLYLKIEFVSNLNSCLADLLWNILTCNLKSRSAQLYWYTFASL